MVKCTGHINNFIIVSIFVVFLAMVFSIAYIKTNANWLVIKEDIYGNSLRYWELKNTCVDKDRINNTIRFTDENGDIIHLTEPYTYIKVKGDFKQVKQKYLKVEKQ